MARCANVCLSLCAMASSEKLGYNVAREVLCDESYPDGAFRVLQRKRYCICDPYLQYFDIFVHDSNT